MTVNTTLITSGPYVGNDIADTFSYGFRVSDKTQLRIFETTDFGAETELTVDTDYTVAGIGDPQGGTVTRVSGALPANYNWYIRADYKKTQLTAFQSQGAFFPDLHENAIDQLTYLNQQLCDLLGRTPRLPDSYIGPLPLTLPSPVAGSLMKWKSDLSGLENLTFAEIDPELVPADSVIYAFNSVADMKASTITHSVGRKLNTGFTTWKVVPAVTRWQTAAGQYVKPLNGLCFLDYGCAGDYFLADKTINPSPTDDALNIQAALDDVDKDGTISGAGCGYYHTTTIKIDTNKKVRDVYYKQADGETSYAVWFGDSVTDVPGNYEGRRLRIKNMTIDPNQTTPTAVRFRGLQRCTFDNLIVEPPSAVVSSDQRYLLMDAVLGTSFTNCTFSPKSGEDDATDTELLRMREMRTLDDLSSAGNGLASTSTSFSGCSFRRVNRLGKILGDQILFDSSCIFETAFYGWNVVATGSTVEFHNDYWENIENWKVYADGVDSRNPSTAVRVIGGKVQMGDNNGSQAGRAFAKAEHGYLVTIDRTVFQGRAQTRLIELASGANSFKDDKISLNANYGTEVRKADGVESGAATIPISSTTVTVVDVGHGRVTGDVIDVVSSDQAEPVNGTNLKLPNRVVTYVDDDTFTYQSIGVTTGAVAAAITYESYQGSASCLANMDAPKTSTTTELGDLRQFGSDLYSFTDCESEFVVFTHLATGALNLQNLQYNGINTWSSDCVAYIKSMRFIDQGDTDATRFANLRYGGSRYTEHKIADVDNSKAAFPSSIKYIAPYRIEPGEPVSVQVTSGGATYPRQVTVIIEVAKTGLTYTKDQ